MQEWALGTKREQTSSNDRKAWNKGWKNESLHLEKIYHSYPWDGWQWIFARPPHFAFSPTVLCMWKKKTAIWKPSEAQLFPLIRVQHCICTAHIHQWTPYGALCSQRAVPGTREVAEPAYHFSLQAAAGGCCCTPHELQLTEWGEGLSHKGPRSYLCAPLPGLSSCTNTPLLFHPRYQAPVSHSWAQTGPSTTPQTVRRMVHGWWQVCNLTASFKKC